MSAVLEESQESLTRLDRANLRALLRGTYDLQQLRIQLGNRIVGNFKVKLGQAPGTREDVLDKETTKILQQIRADYARITDGVLTPPKKTRFTGTGIITSFTEFSLVSEYVELLGQEERHFRQLGKIIEDWPRYGRRTDF